MFNFKQYDWKKYNFALLFIVFFLEICGAFLVKYAGCASYNSLVGASFFKRQIIWAIVSLIITVGVSLIDYKVICDISVFIYISVSFLALATQTPWGTSGGTGDSKARRWLQFPGFTLQPSEVCKIGVILILAVFFAKNKEKMDSFKTFFLGWLLTLVPIACILIQPDLSSSLVIVFIFLVMVFSAGIAYKIILSFLGVTVPLVIGGLWFVQLPVVYNWLGENEILSKVRYQIDRVVAYQHPDQFTADLNYQQNKSILAIASGSLFGKLGKGEISTRNYGNVSVCESDFVFTVIGEEIGFIGSCLLLALLCIVVFMCIRTARRCKDTKGYLIAMGISAMLMFQIFANIGVATMILPNTGLPLPFISKGITSAMCCAISIGIVLNIGMQNGTGDRSGISFL